MKNFEKRGMAIYPFRFEHRRDMNKMYGLIIDYYDFFDCKRFNTPIMTIICANSVVAELNYNDYRREW